jgi:hypothetical protein
MKAFATPRTWEMLSKCLFSLEKSNKNLGLDKNRYKIACGIVGPVGSEFNTFLKTTSKLIPPEEIIKNPKKAKVYGEREIDLLHATVSALEHYIKKKENQKHWKQALQYALRLVPELGIILSKQIVHVIMSKLPPNVRSEAASSDEFMKMFDKYGEHLSTS